MLENNTSIETNDNIELTKAQKLMNKVKNLTIDEYKEFAKEFLTYNSQLIEALGGCTTTNNTNNTTNTTNSKKETKEKNNSFKNHEIKEKKIEWNLEGLDQNVKPGNKDDEAEYDLELISCISQKGNDTIAGGQISYKGYIRNYWYSTQLQLPVIYAPNVELEDLLELKEIIKEELPEEVKDFGEVPDNVIESANYTGRFYTKELKEGNYLYVNPDGSCFGYADGKCFTIYDDGYVSFNNYAYFLCSKGWKKASKEIIKEALNLKKRAVEYFNEYKENNGGEKTLSTRSFGNNKNNNSNKNNKGKSFEERFSNRGKK